MTGKLELYRIFCQVAKYSSFSQAAKTLYLSQPAVSQSVKQLEEQLGVQLFTRGPRGVALTQQGKLLYEYAGSAMGLLDSAEQKLLSMKELSVGELRIAAGDVIIRNLLLPHLERFHKVYPQIHLSILNRTSPESMELLQSGIIDVAFVNLPMEGDQMRIHHTFPIHDIFVAGKRFSWLMDQKQSLKEMTELPLILLERKSNSRRNVDSFFLERGLVIAPEIELTSYDLLREFARIDLGISCVVKEFCQEYLRGGDIFEVPLEEPLPERSVAMVSLKNVSLTPAAAHLLEIIDGKEIEE